MSSIFDQHLEKNAANYVALSPVSFVERSAEVFADLPAVIHGARRYTWAQVRDPFGVAWAFNQGADARLAGVPPQVVARAKAVLDKLEKGLVPVEEIGTAASTSAEFVNQLGGELGAGRA